MSEQKVLNIYQRISAVAKECEYMQKTKADKGQGVEYDEVNATLRDLLIEYGIVTVPRQQSMEIIKELKGNNQVVYQGKYEINLVNIDEPKDMATYVVFSHGMDGGDKGPGKALTYAVKIVYLKAFNMETGLHEESRNEKLAKVTIDQDQIQALAKYCYETVDDELQWTTLGTKLIKANAIDKLEDLPANKFDEVLDKAKAYVKKQGAHQTEGVKNGDN